MKASSYHSMTTSRASSSFFLRMAKAFGRRDGQYKTWDGDCGMREEGLLLDHLLATERTNFFQKSISFDTKTSN